MNPGPRDTGSAALESPSSRARAMRSRGWFDRSQDGLARLGGVVRALRLEHGLGTRALARRSTACRSTIQRLERGQLRPRPSLLRAIAWGLDPDRAPELRQQLFDAVGEDVAADLQGWRRYRARRTEQGWLTGEVPLPGDLARRIDAHRRAAELRRAAYALMDTPGALDDAAVMARAHDMLTESLRLSDIGGGPISIGAGNRRVVYGVD
jgi:transcriptional regulator with XRE-family HTH domain